MSKKKRKAQKVMAQPQNAESKRVSPRFLVGIAVGLCVAIALFLRIVPPFDDIFSGEWVKFASNDAYYYMRLVDSMANNFPHLMSVDPYLGFPDGQPILSYHLFARLLGGISWLVGMGHPTQFVVDTVCVFTPAVMGALVVVPVYFIGRALWGRVAGLIAAALIAILPGEFLGRSILGFADHHVAEVLFTTVSIMFLIMAVKVSRQKCLGFGSLKSRDSIKPITYSLLAGVFFGVYGLTWQGGSLLLFVAALYFVVQFVIDHLRHQSSSYLCMVGFVFYLVAMVVFLPSVAHAYNLSFHLALRGGALLLLLTLGGLSWFMEKKKITAYFYPITLMGLGVAGLGVFYLVNPSLLTEVANVFRFVFMPSSTQLTTIEMQPLLFPQGSFTLSLAWGNFGLALYVAVAALVVLIWDMVKHGNAEKSLIVVWTVVVLFMALGQRRFAYYLAVNVALLAGYLSWRVFKMCGVGEVHKRKARSLFGENANVGFAFLVIILVVFLPVIPNAVSTAGQTRYAPSDAWCESLDWMRENTPEPFGDSESYWRLADGEVNSDSNYGVLAWWDFGYWITRIAHRIPNVNPGQNPVAQTAVATFFTSQDEQIGNGIVDGLGAKYVVIDRDTVTGKFWAIARYAGKDQSNYYGVYYVVNDSQMVPVQLFYPDYYRSLAVRLYNFDARATVPQDVIAISWEGRADQYGNTFSLITNGMKFATYEEAEAYVAAQTFGNWQVISDNPYVSPVPLEALKQYQLVYQSSNSEVKIFRYGE